MSGRRGDLLSFLYLVKRLTRPPKPGSAHPEIRAMFRLMIVFFGLAMFWPLFTPESTRSGFTGLELSDVRGCQFEAFRVRMCQGACPVGNGGNVRRRVR